MTVAILAMNADAVALASDSATFSTLPSGSTRSYHAHDKILRFDPELPLGVLLYGETRLAGIPWDALLYRFRQQKPKPLSTVNEYAGDFHKWLSQSQWVTEDRKREAWQSRLVGIVGDRVNEAVNIRSSHPLAAADFGKRLVASTRKLRSELRESGRFLPGKSEEDIVESRRKHEYVFGQAIDAAVGDRGDLPRSALHELLDLLAEASCLEAPVADAAGVVFAGFGADQVLPSYSATVFYGFDETALQTGEPDNVELAGVGVGTIKAFAEPDEAVAFLAGRASEEPLTHAWEDMVGQLVEHLAEMSVRWNEPDVSIPDMIQAVVPGLAEKVFRGKMHRSQTVQIPTEVSAAVGALPREQLAMVAEDFARLAILRQRVSSVGDETVGGQVDVGLISCSEGFRWAYGKQRSFSGLGRPSVV